LFDTTGSIPVEHGDGGFGGTTRCPCDDIVSRAGQSVLRAYESEACYQRKMIGRDTRETTPMDPQ
jgi:hypothetical protein